MIIIAFFSFFIGYIVSGVLGSGKIADLNNEIFYWKDQYERLNKTHKELLNNLLRKK